jgi:hypothetical protein
MGIEINLFVSTDKTAVNGNKKEKLLAVNLI